MSEDALTWLNGCQQATISVSDRGLSYGDGLFETVALADGRAPLLPAHWRRLRHGCARLGITVDMECLQQEFSLLLQHARQYRRSVAKVTVTRGQGGRGYAPPESGKETRLLQLLPWPRRPQSWWRDGVSVYACKTPCSHNPVLAGIKHLNRLENVLARQECDDPEFAEGLMQDGSGAYVCGTSTNLFLVVDGVLCTPELANSGVRGVLRQQILDDWGSSLGVELRLGRVDETMIESASELFLTNALIGAWPIRKFGSRQWSRGQVCLGVQRRVSELFDG